MILITCEYVDSNHGAANYNGGWSQQCYNLQEARDLANAISLIVPAPGITQNLGAIVCVYQDGVIKYRYYDGTLF